MRTQTITLTLMALTIAASQLLFTSCGSDKVVSSSFIQKRKYTKGYHVDLYSENQSKAHKSSAEYAPEKAPNYSQNNEGNNAALNQVEDSRNVICRNTLKPITSKNDENNQYASVKHAPMIFSHKGIKASNPKVKMQTFITHKFNNHIYSVKKQTSAKRNGNTKNILLVTGGIIEVIGISLALSGFGVPSAAGTYAVGVALMAIGGLLGLIGYLMNSD